MVKINDYRSSINNEIHLRQLTIDEALPILDKYLNDVFMAGITQVVVIHGKGTGILRNAIHKQLATHPLVKSYRQGVYGEGGSGVTVVELSHR
ncbi:MAG: Smr/MutS family protein [Dehalococcoidia bacterium]|nr:MAG: Smr/MutS family protein [Dehalococcoidia bacterium]